MRRNAENSQLKYYSDVLKNISKGQVLFAFAAFISIPAPKGTNDLASYVMWKLLYAGGGLALSKVLESGFSKAYQIHYGRIQRRQPDHTKTNDSSVRPKLN